MAKLTHMPSRTIIDGFKGKIDYYLYMGIPCARMWPVWRKREPYAAERAGQEDFAAISKAAITLPLEIIEAYMELAQGTPFTWKDLMTRTYMRGLWV